MKQFLELPKGIPSHDTLGRVFAKIDPAEFQRSFRKWVQAVKENQGKLHEAVRFLFEYDQQHDFQGAPNDYSKTVNKGHSRIDVRQC